MATVIGVGVAVGVVVGVLVVDEAVEWVVASRSVGATEMAMVVGVVTVLVGVSGVDLDVGTSSSITPVLTGNSVAGAVEMGLSLFPALPPTIVVEWKPTGIVENSSLFDEVKDTGRPESLQCLVEVAC